MRLRLLLAALSGLIAGVALPAKSDTAAVAPHVLHLSDFTGDGVFVPGLGRVPGVALDSKAGALRLMVGDDSLFSTVGFDDRHWLKLRYLDSLAGLNAPAYWSRYHFVLDSTCQVPALNLHVVCGGRLDVWLDGQSIARVNAPLTDLSSTLRRMPDTAALYMFSFALEHGPGSHVLAFRMVQGRGPLAWGDVRASLHDPRMIGRLQAISVNHGILAGVNAFIFLMALIFWRMDPKDRVWPWFAALTAVNAFIASSNLAEEVELGLGKATDALIETGDALMLLPLCLSIIVLLVLKGSRKRWWIWVYLGTAIAFALLKLFMPSANTFLAALKLSRYDTIIGIVFILLSICVSAVWVYVDAIRLSVRVALMRGYARWIGIGVLISSFFIVAPFLFALLVKMFTDSDATPPYWFMAFSDHLVYIAVPLCIIVSLAIRSAHQNKMLARQRDDLDREVHERTAELRQERDRSETLLLNILPQEVAEELKATGAAEAKHFDQATVLFTDFKGFTAMSEKVTPVELLAELNSCFKAFDDIIARRGIEKIKTIGDAYMCVGGLPDPKSSAPIDVVLAALEMQEFMTKRCAERTAAGTFAFEMRSGINTGPVVAGIVGVKKFQYDIWGDTVNMASRMETTGEVRRVNISAGTHALVKDIPGLRFTKRGMVEVKGKGSAEMWFVDRA